MKLRVEPDDWYDAAVDAWDGDDDPDFLLPGAYYDRYGVVRDGVVLKEPTHDIVVRRTECDAMREGKPWAVRLLIHEVGHYLDGIEPETTNFDHPSLDRPVKVFWHALRCGFDARAATRLLRWRRGPWLAEAKYAKRLLAEYVGVSAPTPQT